MTLAAVKYCCWGHWLMGEMVRTGVLSVHGLSRMLDPRWPLLPEIYANPSRQRRLWL